MASRELDRLFAVAGCDHAINEARRLASLDAEQMREHKFGEWYVTGQMQGALLTLANKLESLIALVQSEEAR